nr:hypothetical protein 35 [bacterium]
MPLQDSDNFIVGRGSDTYKITYQDLKDDLNYVPPPTGTIDTPTVLSPNDGAGGGGSHYAKTDGITAVEGSGIYTCETDTIQSVSGGGSPSYSVEVTGWNSPGNAIMSSGTSSRASAAAGEWGTLEFTPALINVTKIRVYTRFNVKGQYKFTDKDGTTTTFDKTGSGTQWYELYNDSSNPLTLAKYEQQADNNSTSDDFWAIEINDQLVFVPGLTDPNQSSGVTNIAGDATTVLSFPSAKGFDCFEPGDVVQVEEPDGLKGSTGIYLDGFTGNFYVSAVEINGKLLGPSNSGTTVNLGPYSDNATTSNGKWHDGNAPQGAPPEYGSHDTYWRPAPGGKVELYWTVPIDIESLRIQCAVGSGQAGDVANVYDRTTGELLFITNPLQTQGLRWVEVHLNDDVITKVVSKDPDATPPTITVDGGTWTTSDKLVKETPYDTKLTLAGSNDLADMSGSVFATDGSTNADGSYSQTPYKLTTTDIQSVSGTAPNITLTFPGAVSTNPDLQYFEAGDVVQSDGNSITNDQIIRHFTSTTSLPDYFADDGSNIPNYEDAKSVIVATGNTGEHAYFENVINAAPVETKQSWTLYKLDHAYSTLTFSRYPNLAPVNVFASPTGLAGTWELIHTSTTSTTPYTVATDDGTKYLYWCQSFRSRTGDFSTNYFIGSDPTKEHAVISTGYPDSNTMVVDGGTWNNGDKVEYQTKGGKGEVVSVDTGTNTMLVTDSADRDERWIAGHSVAGPTVIDDPLLTNEVEFLCSTFATTPKGEDVLTDIIWDIDGTEYDVDTQNPWKPLTNLSPNTHHTVRVKHKGLLLGESAWSPTVSFTTGNSFKSLIDRVSALESNDVIDDATDTALINLIAGLAARIQALEEAN